MSETDFYPAAGEKNVVGRFEWFNQVQVAESREADEIVTKKIITLRSRAIGSSDDSVVPVRPHNQAQAIARFPEAWKAFNGDGAPPVAGTPLSDIGIDENTELNMRLYGVLVIEQLATISDAACTNIGFGTRKWREKAMAFIAERKEAGIQKAVEMAAAPEAKRGPGRPRKAA